MSINKQDLITVRDSLPNDRNFVLATFLRGLYYGNELFNLMPRDLFMRSYHAIAETLVDGGTVKVACLKDDPEVILGYALFSSKTPTLHWLFVKTNWRNIGIAKSLVPEGTKTVTHLSKTGIGLLKKHPEMIFNPFQLP